MPNNLVVSKKVAIFAVEKKEFENKIAYLWQKNWKLRSWTR